MEKGYILTNARGFARQMCSASHPPQCLETNSYHLLPPPDNNPQQALGTEDMGFPCTHLAADSVPKGQSQCLI